MELSRFFGEDRSTQFSLNFHATLILDEALTQREEIMFCLLLCLSGSGVAWISVSCISYCRLSWRAYLTCNVGSPEISSRSGVATRRIPSFWPTGRVRAPCQDSWLTTQPKDPSNCRCVFLAFVSCLLDFILAHMKQEICNHSFVSVWIHSPPPNCTAPWLVPPPPPNCPPPHRLAWGQYFLSLFALHWLHVSSKCHNHLDRKTTQDISQWTLNQNVPLFHNRSGSREMSASKCITFIPLEIRYGIKGVHINLSSTGNFAQSSWKMTDCENLLWIHNFQQHTSSIYGIPVLLFLHPSLALISPSFNVLCSCQGNINTWNSQCLRDVEMHSVSDQNSSRPVS